MVLGRHKDVDHSQIKRNHSQQNETKTSAYILERSIKLDKGLKTTKDRGVSVNEEDALDADDKNVTDECFLFLFFSFFYVRCVSDFSRL